MDKKSNRLLRSYRTKKGLTIADLAKQLGMAESTVRSLENGNRNISPETAFVIEKVTKGELTRRKLLPRLFGEIAA